MCGIVGHIGPKSSVEIVLEGLKRLEYRGYDSAGVSFINKKGDNEVYKKTGKLENLVGELNGKDIVAQATIGHTRWATHGEVTDANSHPHFNGSISLVHNGIIENYAELKEELAKNGYDFKSDTDSETFLALVMSEMKEGVDFRQSVINSFKKIRGNSAFVILNSKLKEIVAVRRGAPLVCGIGSTASQVLVSSDPYALAGEVERLYFPEDEVICHLSGGNKNLLRFFEFDGSESTRIKKKDADKDVDKNDKGEYEHFMLKEIHEQPGLIRAITQYYFTGEGRPFLEELANLKPKNIHLSACGTASYAGQVVRDYFENFNKIPSRLQLASELRYRQPLFDKEDLSVFISQSGETADTLAAQELLKKEGVKTLSLVNVEDSTLYRECDHNLLIRAGMEIGVASTKAFTQMCLCGRLLSFAMEGYLSDKEKCHELVKKFSLLAERIEELLDRVPDIKKIAETIHDERCYFFTGRGIYFPVAEEGALKLKEIAYVHAEGYASGELKHGPIALVDEHMVNIAIIGPELYEKTLSNVEEIKARKGIIVSIGPEGDKRAMDISDHYIPMNFEGLDEVSPLYVNVANQLLAYYLALFKGTDIDKPRNLAKSVTVE